MSENRQGDVTLLLKQIDSGDALARDRLLEVAYDELRAMAGGLMHNERRNHTLEPTALVHEAALKLLDREAFQHIPSRAWFFSAMARAMRCILVDHARARRASKRGGGQKVLPLDEALDRIEQTHRLDLLGLEEALQRLETVDQRMAEVVTLRFFGGLELKEIADQLGVSLSTVEKTWRLARAWLRQQLDSTTTQEG